MVCSRVGFIRGFGFRSILLSLQIIVAGAFLLPAQTKDPAFDLLLEAQKLILDGEIDSAEELLNQVAREFPSDGRVFNLLGVVRAQKGEYIKAEKDFRKALDLIPGLTGAYLNLGRLYQENLAEDPEAKKKGIAVYRALLSFQPQNLEALYQVAFLLHLDGKYRESLAYLAQLPESEASRSEVQVLNCANRLAVGERDLGESIMRELISQNRFQEADLLPVLPAILDSGHTDLAIRMLENLHLRGSLSIPSCEGLATLYGKLGKYRDARILLESIAGRHPDLPALLVRLAWLSFDQADYEGSLRYLAHARDLKPDDGKIHIFFGLACMELDLGLEAVNSLEKGVALEPENPYYNYALGSAILAWKEAREAIPYFEMYHQLRPEDPRGEAALAQAYFLNKQYDLARAGFEKARQYPQTELISNYYLGVIARIELRLEEAENYFRQVLTNNPDHADTLAEMGWIHTRRREFDSAKKVLDRALEIDPENYHANFNLLTLYSRTRDKRFKEQQARFEKIKEKRWQHLTESLRSIEVIPHYVFPGRRGTGVFGP